MCPLPMSPIVVMAAVTAGRSCAFHRTWTEAGGTYAPAAATEPHTDVPTRLREPRYGDAAAAVTGRRALVRGGPRTPGTRERASLGPSGEARSPARGSRDGRVLSQGRATAVDPSLTTRDDSVLTPGA